MVTMDSTPTIPRPPPPPSTISQNIKPSSICEVSENNRNSPTSVAGGFRLVDDAGDTTSVYSACKQRIDAMFESDSSTTTRNSVQAKIERMFSDVAQDGGGSGCGEGTHGFTVDYLGSVGLQEKVTSLVGLQEPLRELYFGYKKEGKDGRKMVGRLEISSAGLKVLYQGENGETEHLNSFPTIAVWSAVKFVTHDLDQTTYAFLPLITDPDNIDKQTLFRRFTDNERHYIPSDCAHSPLFAVVMRGRPNNSAENGLLHRQLECHAFVCQTSEDAIVIAATLYKSLMAHMREKEGRGGQQPKCRNGIATCGVSVASSDMMQLQAPVRPPRKKRGSIASSSNNSETQPLLEEKAVKKSVKSRKAPKAPQDLDAILPFDEVDDGKEKPHSFTEKWNNFMTNQQKQINEEIKQVLKDGSNAGLKRVKSVRRRNAEENSGDILTKVTIPRSGSFLNAGGLTRYKSKVYKSNGQATGGSPLGFNELFNEFRLQEGLHSVDEILAAIIDPEGMSFNDLKPIYKEFLLKLAVTLTKDELYQRSKAIMRRQRKRSKHMKKLKNSNVNKKRNTVVTTRLKKTLSQIFRRNTSKMPGHFPSVPPKLPESSISTSSYDTRHFQSREDAPNASAQIPLISRKQSYRKQHRLREAGGERASTSEESDFFSVRRSKPRQGPKMERPNGGGVATQNRNSSSGYVSCSECSYDSDTCTCTSADKCYCSLGGRNMGRRVDGCYCNGDNAPTFCGCDTDSCTESNKCYCQLQPPPKTSSRRRQQQQRPQTISSSTTIFEQLKQRGFIPPAEVTTLTPPPYHRKLCKRRSNTRSTRSLEYMHNPTEKYFDKVCRKVGENGGSQRDFVVYERRRGSVGYLGEYEVYDRRAREANSKGSVASLASRGKPIREITTQCSEALSVKKSAEIAALFADIKLSQTTDITHMVPKKHRGPGKVLYSNLPSNSLPFDNHVVHNSLYYSSRDLRAVRNNNGKMYSAKNGLYTIQSQSDDSSRSGKGRKSDYFTMESQIDGGKNVSSSLENSLGYLP